MIWDAHRYMNEVGGILMSNQVSNIDQFYNSYYERKNSTVSKEAENMSEKIQSPDMLQEVQDAFCNYMGGNNEAVIMVS